MTHRSDPHSRARGVLLALASAAVCNLALGADRSAAIEARAVYERELAVCKRGQSNQDRATCLREANAAFAEARRGGLTGDAATFPANALRRCEALPAPDRKDCVARMRGQGTTRGSVAEGGIYRELVTREAGVQAAAPASAAK